MSIPHYLRVFDSCCEYAAHWGCVCSLKLHGAQVNEFVKRVRAAKIHVLIMGHLRKQMPSMMGKQKAQDKLLRDLPTHFAHVQREHHLPAGAPIHPKPNSLSVHREHTCPQMPLGLPSRFVVLAWCSKLQLSLSRLLHGQPITLGRPRRGLPRPAQLLCIAECKIIASCSCISSGRSSSRSRVRGSWRTQHAGACVLEAQPYVWTPLQLPWNGLQGLVVIPTSDICQYSLTYPCTCAGDFPDVNRYREILSAYDLSVFPKLREKDVKTIEDVLSLDIPSLVKQFDNPYQ